MADLREWMEVTEKEAEEEDEDEDEDEDEYYWKEIDETPKPVQMVVRLEVNVNDGDEFKDCFMFWKAVEWKIDGVIF